MKKAITIGLVLLSSIGLLAGCTAGMPNDVGASTAANSISSMGTTILMFVAIIAVFYFMMIRPQQKQKKAYTEMMKNLKVGDRVKTIGKMYGRIVEIKDETVTIETGRDKVRLVFDRSAISTVEGGNEESNADLQ